MDPFSIGAAAASALGGALAGKGGPESDLRSFRDYDRSATDPADTLQRALDAANSLGGQSIGAYINQPFDLQTTMQTPASYTPVGGFGTAGMFSATPGGGVTQTMDPGFQGQWQFDFTNPFGDVGGPAGGDPVGGFDGLPPDRPGGGQQPNGGMPPTGGGGSGPRPAPQAASTRTGNTEMADSELGAMLELLQMRPNMMGAAVPRRRR